MFLLEIASALQNFKVNYAIVGGYAVALHGAVRGTLDIDVVLHLSKSSFIKAEEAFKSVGLISKLPVTAAEVYEFRQEYIDNRNLIAWSFMDPKNPSRLVDVIITEDLSKIKSVQLKIQGSSVSVASLPSLIEMKTRSARPQDIEDVKALKIIMEK